MAPIFIVLGKILLPMVVREAANKIIVKATQPKESNMQVILGLIRHVLTAVGGYFVAKGAIDNETVEVVVGGVVAIVGAAWSVVEKKNKGE